MENEKKENWEKRLEDTLSAFRVLKKYDRTVALMTHDFPVWKLGKSWEIEGKISSHGKYYTAHPKDERLSGLTLFS